MVFFSFTDGQEKCMLPIFMSICIIYIDKYKEDDSLEYLNGQTELTHTLLYIFLKRNTVPDPEH